MSENIAISVQATTYPDSVRIFIPNIPIRKNVSKSPKGSRINLFRSAEDIEYIYETNLERSIRRSRKAIKDYILCNDFDLFCTFTMGKDRYNDEKSIKRLKNWVKNQRDRNGKFIYIFVTERHKDGALHFHALIGGYKGKLAPAINPNAGNPKLDINGLQVYNFTEYTHGFTTVRLIVDKNNKTKTARYLQKYVGKDLAAGFGKNRYWASKGLNKPTIQDNPDYFYHGVQPVFTHINDHGKIFEFVRGQTPEIDAYIEANQP